MDKKKSDALCGTSLLEHGNRIEDNIAADPFAKFQRLCHIDRMGDISNIVIEIH